MEKECFRAPHSESQKRLKKAFGNMEETKKTQANVTKLLCGVAVTEHGSHREQEAQEAKRTTSLGLWISVVLSRKMMGIR